MTHRELPPIRLPEHPTRATRIAVIVIEAALALAFLAFAYAAIWATGAHAGSYASRAVSQASPAGAPAGRAAQGPRPLAVHDALPSSAKPLGWSYPASCCSGYDCREVPRAAVSERPEGYVIEGTGETLSYADGRLKDSPDGAYHRCSVGGADDSRTICLFVPPRGF